MEYYVRLPLTKRRQYLYKKQINLLSTILNKDKYMYNVENNTIMIKIKVDDYDDLGDFYCPKDIYEEALDYEEEIIDDDELDDIYDQIGDDFNTDIRISKMMRGE